jgi:hypothetical protein
MTKEWRIVEFTGGRDEVQRRLCSFLNKRRIKPSEIVVTGNEPRKLADAHGNTSLIHYLSVLVFTKKNIAS